MIALEFYFPVVNLTFLSYFKWTLYAVTFHHLILICEMFTLMDWFPDVKLYQAIFCTFFSFHPWWTDRNFSTRLTTQYLGIKIMHQYLFNRFVTDYYTMNQTCYLSGLSPKSHIMIWRLEEIYVATNFMVIRFL